MKYPLVFTVLGLCLIGAGCTQSSITPAKTDVENSSATTIGTKLDLSGQGLTQISQDIFKQTNLIELNLSHNRLTGAIPGEIRLLSNLEMLDLSKNFMTGLPAKIGQLSRLKTLNLSNNQLTGLPLELGQLKNLETLDLRGNDYSKQDLDQIRKSLSGTNILTD